MKIPIDSYSSMTYKYFTHDGSTIYLSGLAGGTYHLTFQYIRSDGVRVG